MLKNAIVLIILSLIILNSACTVAVDNNMEENSVTIGGNNNAEEEEISSNSVVNQNQSSSNTDTIASTLIGALVINQNLTSACTAAAINQNYILTSARCIVPGLPFSAYQYYPSENSISSVSRSIHVSNINIHPLWRSNSVWESQHFDALNMPQNDPFNTGDWYDIAILKLSEPLGQAVPLPPSSQPGNQEIVIAGYVSNANRLSQNISTQRISSVQKSIFNVQGNSPICGTAGGSAAFLTTNSTQYEIIGIFSFADCSQGLAFTALYPHKSFIADALQNNISMDPNAYVIQGGIPNNNDDPNNNNNNNNTTGFDCAMTSDGFCDSSCPSLDVDCMQDPFNPGASFGESCTGNIDCASRICAQDSMGRKFCSQLCSMGCPQNFECIDLPNTRSDICGPKAPAGPAPMNPGELQLFGGPCTNDSQCFSGACYQGFCTETCTNNESCPLGFECLAAGNRRLCQ